jgi:hypothetical protein
MTNRNFTVIKGGLSYPKGDETRTFVSAFVTDTRLMGVVGLYIHWNIKSGSESSDFHQFFYFDAEEYGFETYRSISSSDTTEIKHIEQALIGGLGGNKVGLTQREATALIHLYVEMNHQFKTQLPYGESEYKFLLETEIELTDDERISLFKKQCAKVTSEYQAINYFFICFFSNDYMAAQFLVDGDFPLDICADIPVATLCKNSIEHFENESGTSYLCESLIEHDTSYVLVVTEITLNNLKVASFERRSSMQVSAVEAAMMLSRSEFVTVYDIVDDPDDFEVNFSKFTAGSLLTMHDSGRLFLSFNQNNDHVGKKVFRLNEDVFGLYYVTDLEQLIIAAYSIKGIQSIEKELLKNSLANSLFLTAKYEFKEPVLYEFIQSGFEDFDDFLDFIKD